MRIKEIEDIVELVSRIKNGGSSLCDNLQKVVEHVSNSQGFWLAEFENGDVVICSVNPGTGPSGNGVIVATKYVNKDVLPFPKGWKLIKQEEEPRIKDGYKAVSVFYPGYWLVIE